MLTASATHSYCTVTKHISAAAAAAAGSSASRPPDESHFVD